METDEDPDNGASPEDCPLAETDDKVDEAHYFLHEDLTHYHEPSPFRFSLNAFIQALCSVTFYLQSDLVNAADFAQWYAPYRLEMRTDPLLQRFVEGRNLVVHRRSLEAASHVEVGVFRRDRAKLVFGTQIPPSVSSKELLSRFRSGSRLMDAGHIAIGEQLGVRRKWVVPELDPDQEAMTTCHVAWARIHRVVAQGHRLIGRTQESPDEEPSATHDVEAHNLLLESDLDPDAFKRWGWT